MSVHFRPAAVEDIDSAADYIAKDSIDRAVKFYAAVRQTVSFVAAMPGAGTEVSPRDPALAGMRRIVVAGFRNHVIYYLPRKRALEIVRVLHGARDRDRLLGLK